MSSVAADRIVELHILLLPTCEKLLNIFIQVFLFASMLSSKKTLISAFAHAIIFLLFFAPLTFSHYSSASQDTSTAITEDIDAGDISALIQSTTQHVNETEKAIESGNSTVALCTWTFGSDSYRFKESKWEHNRSYRLCFGDTALN